MYKQTNKKKKPNLQTNKKAKDKKQTKKQQKKVYSSFSLTYIDLWL